MFVKVTTEVRSDNTGNSVIVPGVLTELGLLMPLLDYFLEHTHRSPSWMDKVVRSVRLLCYYMTANPHEVSKRALFDNFARALEQGTFNLATGEDPSGLCWQPLSGVDRDAIITDLTLLFDWMTRDNKAAAEFNPLVPASAYDQRLNEASRAYKRENKLLGHLWTDRTDDSKKRRVGRLREPVPKASTPLSFPENRFDELIEDGFRVGNRVDHRNICITLLLHGAGFRASEPFHMYVEDAVPNPKDPSSALVAIHHPSAGFAPGHWVDPIVGGRGKRGAYLAAMYGLKPRHKLHDTNRAGWKGGRYDAENYKRAFWFTPSYGAQFLHHWNCYLEQLAHVKRKHPFLFVNMERGNLGDMYKLGTFNDAHAAACRRIGLVPAKVLGTSPHGHRHAYGQRLRRAGLDAHMRQIALHHSNMASQEVYTEPSLDEIIDALQTADDTLRQSLLKSVQTSAP